MHFPFSFWKPSAPPSPPAWQTGSLGDLTLTDDSLEWDTDNIYDYNNITLNNVSILIGGDPTGKPVIVGALGNLSMTNCVIVGTQNQDILFYDPFGDPLPKYNYTKTPSGGPMFSYDVEGAQGGNGGSDNGAGNQPGFGLWGSGGGGSSSAGITPATSGSTSGGGTGGDGSDASGEFSSTGGSGGGVYGNGGGDGQNSFFGAGGGGGALGLSGNNIMFAVWGNVTTFTSNTINLSGGTGGNGGNGGGGGSGVGGGGGGGGAGGFGGMAQFYIHGSGSNLVTSDNFVLYSGAGGTGGIGGNGTLAGNNGNDGSAGQNGVLQVQSY